MHRAWACLVSLTSLTYIFTLLCLHCWCFALELVQLSTVSKSFLKLIAKSSLVEYFFTISLPQSCYLMVNCWGEWSILFLAVFSSLHACSSVSTTLPDVFIYQIKPVLTYCQGYFRLISLLHCFMECSINEISCIISHWIENASSESLIVQIFRVS